MENKGQRYFKAVNMLDVMENSQFAKLMKKGLLINEINDNLKPAFPAEFRQLIRFGQIQDNALFIEVPNAMVRQSILFREKNLLPVVQQKYPEIQRFNVKINPEFKL